jgi:hypothetical protein
MSDRRPAGAGGVTKLTDPRPSSRLEAGAP